MQLSKSAQKFYRLIGVDPAKVEAKIDAMQARSDSIPLRRESRGWSKNGDASLDARIVCRSCQVAGQVRTRRVVIDRKTMTRMRCSNCGMDNLTRALDYGDYNK